MDIASRLILGAVASLLALSMVDAVRAEAKYAGKTSALEIAMLPKYCYAQYVDDRLGGDPQYSIHGCGQGMNHLCPGLVLLNRAQKVSRPKSERREDLRMAKENLSYTIARMTPECSLRSEVEAAMQKAVMQERIVK